MKNRTISSNSTISRGALTARLKAAKNAAEEAKAKAKAAKAELKQARKAFKEARKTAKTAKKAVKALKAEVAAVRSPRKRPTKKPAPVVADPSRVPDSILEPEEMTAPPMEVPPAMPPH